MLKLINVKRIETKSGIRYIARYILNGRNAATFIPAVAHLDAEHYLAEKFGVDVDPDANMTAGELFGEIREAIHTGHVGRVKPFISKRNPECLLRAAREYAAALGFELGVHIHRGNKVLQSSARDTRPNHPSFLAHQVWEMNSRGTHHMWYIQLTPNDETFRRMMAMGR